MLSLCFAGGHLVGKLVKASMEWLAVWFLFLLCMQLLQLMRRGLRNSMVEVCGAVQWLYESAAQVFAVSGREEHVLLFLPVSGAPTGQRGVRVTSSACKRGCAIITRYLMKYNARPS